MDQQRLSMERASDKVTLWHVYYRNGSFLIPVVAKTDVGFFLDIGPVMVVPREDTSALVEALAKAAAVGNPRVPTPSRDAYPPPVVLAPAGVKTWKTFEEKSICWTITADGNGYALDATGRSPGGGWSDQAGPIKIPQQRGVPELVVAILDHLQRRDDV